MNYRIMIAEQPPHMPGAYLLQDLDDRDSTAIREGRMVLASIRMQKRRTDGDWVVRADKLNFTVAPDVVGEYPHFEEIATRRCGSGPRTCGVPRSKCRPGRRPCSAGS